MTRQANFWVLPVSVLGSSLGFIDSSVVNVALPAIQADLRAPFASVQWVTNGYLLTLASLILIGGALGDRFGTLRAFASGLMAFTVASVACGLSGSAEALIVARLFQGAGAAVLMPTSLALISQTYRGEARGKAIGTWAAAGGILMAFGPPLGGWLVQTAGWRSIFFINVPVALLALGLSWPIRHIGQRPKDRSLDVVGAMLAVATLASLTFGLIEYGAGNARIGSSALIATLPIFAGFIFVEYRSRSPMMPLRLFRDTTFAGANALTVVLYGGLGAAIFMLPFDLIEVHKFEPSAAGLAFLPLSIILGLGSRYSGGFAGRVGNRIPLILGPLIAASGFATLAMLANQSTYALAFFPGLVLLGVGMTLAVPALTTAIFDSAPDEDSGAASGINNAAARSGSLIATALLGIAFGNTGISAMATAYVTVMWCAAIASLLSAAIASFSIAPPTPNS